MYETFLKLTSRLPLGVARSIGRPLGYLYYRLAKKRVHVARVNMDICYPELSESEKEERVRNSFRQAGAWMMEAGPIWMWPPEKLLKSVCIRNPELYEQALAENKGLILAIPHLGNWEVLGPVVAASSEFACFYKRDDKNPGFSDFVRSRRSRHTRMASTDPSGVRLLYKHLKAGKVIGLLPDHNPTEEMGVFAPFFNRPALTGTLITSLAKKHGAPVLTAAAIRTPNGFEVEFGEVENQHSDDPVLAATCLNHAIEKCISLAPEQYQWVYPRFKKRQDPEHMQSPYRVARS